MAPTRNLLTRQSLTRQPCTRHQPHHGPTRGVALLGLLVVFVMGCSPARDRRDPQQDAATIRAVGGDYMTRQLAESTYLRFRRGLPITTLPDLTEAASAEQADFARGLLDRLAEVQTENLEHEDWLSLALLRWDLGLAVEAPRHYWPDFNVTPYAGGQTLNLVHQVFAAYDLGNPEGRTGYLELTGEYADMLEQLGDKTTGQIERGVFLPRAQVPNVRALFAGLRARAEPLLVPSSARLSDLQGDEPARRAFLDRLDELLGRRMKPAYDRLLSLFGDNYLAAAPEAVGLNGVPGGPELYLYRVRLHTTTEKTPEEIHQLGQEEVAKLDTEMATIRDQLGFSGTAAEFHQKVRTDPRFLAKNPDEVEQRYQRYIDRIEPLIDRWFTDKPAAPYGVRRLDPTAEASMTFGFYQPPTPNNPRGEYHYNASDLPNRSLFTAGPLIYHELVPGHHFQIALQNEHSQLPDFRRDAALGYTAFVEGWADYAAALGQEMGLYEDPYDRYAALSMDMFVACRLVVDTGMNALGWSLERAREFLSERVIYSPAEIATELLRYSADLHGQALAYHLGHLEIARLRQRAEQALGDRFDIREFHRAVIGSGAMPLVVLDEHLAWWIEQRKLEPRKSDPSG